MRNLFSIAALALLAFSCGEAGVGFNIGKEFPLVIPVELDAGATGGLPGDPPSITNTDTYSLEGAGFDDLENLEEVEVVGLAFEITGVSAAESFDLDGITIELETNFGNQIALINITTPQLSNVAKTEISDASGLNALQQALDNEQDIISNVTFDFGEIPDEDIAIEFVLYFDVVVKIRDL